MSQTKEIDYYEVLGVDRNASADEIKKAFRRQAVKNHPDQGGDEAKFKRLNQAYEVLSNPDKKQRYDQFGAAGLGGQGQPGSSGAKWQNAQGFDFRFGGADFDLGDIFGSFFGGRQSGQGQARPADAEVSLEIDFAEAVFGIEHDVSVSLDDVCLDCDGRRASAAADIKKCSVCQGKGQVQQTIRSPLGPITHASACRNCAGSGEIVSQPCRGCNGRGVVTKSKKIKIAIPGGVEDGTIIRASGEGPKDRHGRAGELYLLLRVRPHKQFTREGNLILSQQSISMVAATLGAEIDVETIDGPVTIQVPPGTQSGTDFKLAGHGVPRINSQDRGDHIVSLTVEIPTKLNRQQRDILSQFADA